MSLYLPTEQAGKGQVHFTVRQGEREVWRETVGFDAQPGGTVVRWAYQIGRLRGDGLQVDARAVWPGGETALNAELLNLSPESLKQQAQAVAERAFAFRKRLEAARNAGVAVDYPLTALAVCDVTLKYRRRDLEKPALLKEYALLPKIRRQFRQLDAMLERAEQELAGLESGALKPRPVPAPPMRNLTIRDGAFYSGDEEVLLIGPLGWWEPFDDLKSLSELGFNLFSSTLIAQAVTPAPDKVRLDGARRIDRGLREAAKYNLAFDFLISPHPLPQGWKEKHPEMAQYPSGGWIGSSLYHTATRTMIDAMWKNLLPVVRDNPNLIALDLVNEWSFSDGVREIHPVMLAKFRAAMRERYGSVAAANRNWGTDCRDFDSLDPMKLKRVSTGFRYDFESFRNREGLENLRFLRDTARKYAPGTPLHVKSIAVTDLDPGQYLPVGVQREERGEITDFAGSDCAGIMELDFYRSMVPGKPAADTEFHVSVNTTPHEMAADAWSAMLHGESLREYYAWTGRYSAELMAAGALLHIPESLEALGRTALDLRRLAPEVVAFQRRIPDAEVALLYSPASMYTVPEYPARLRRAHAELSHLDLPVRFLSERQLAAGKTGQVKVLVIPGAQRLERETAEALADFAARGGTILATPGNPVHRSLRSGTARLPGARKRADRGRVRPRIRPARPEPPGARQPARRRAGTAFGRTQRRNALLRRQLWRSPGVPAAARRQTDRRSDRTDLRRNGEVPAPAPQPQNHDLRGETMKFFFFLSLSLLVFSLSAADLHWKGKGDAFTREKPGSYIWWNLGLRLAPGTYQVKARIRADQGRSLHHSGGGRLHRQKPLAERREVPERVRRTRLRRVSLRRQLPAAHFGLEPARLPHGLRHAYAGQTR